MIRPAIICALMATQAASQPRCQPREMLVALLADKYQENQRAYGIAASGQMMELFTGESGSWSIVVSNPNGISCLVADGHDFISIATPPEGDPL